MKVVGMHVISLDFETASKCDLKTHGVYVYANHPTTDVLCAAFSLDDIFVKQWRPGDPYPFASLGPIQIFAFNAAFERLIWNSVMTRRYGWPEMRIEDFVCTAAQCRMNAIAGNLDDASRMLDVKVKKDRSGHLHMLRMCRPDANGNWAHHTREALDRLAAYCVTDVEAEIGVRRKLPEFNGVDLENYHLNEAINDRGLIVDHLFAAQAVTFAEEERAWFDTRIAEITGGAATKATQKQRLKTWLKKQLAPAAWDCLLEYDGGVKKAKLDVNARERLLTAAADDPELLAPDVLELVELLDASSKAAVAKYQRMLDCATGGDIRRVQGAYVFAGGQQTGRYASRLLQVHNFVRNVPREAADIYKAVHESGPERLRGHRDEKGREIPAIHMLARLVRPAITGCPYGDFDLVWGDFGQIEARMLPWLADDTGAADRLEVFRSGEDIYRFTADAMGLAIYDDAGEITKESRQSGKVLELACGYGGGQGSVANFAKLYRVDINPAFASTLVSRWRENNLWAVRFWDQLMRAAFCAVRSPGGKFAAGRVRFRFDPAAFGGIGALWMRLPSGREIAYPGARIEMVTTAWGERTVGLTAMKASWKPKADSTEWPRVNVYHGLLANNCTQGAAADVLMDAIAECAERGLRVVGHTHDEIILESAAAERDAATLKALMITPPAWAEGLPLAAKVHHGYRYSVE